MERAAVRYRSEPDGEGASGPPSSRGAAGTILSRLSRPGTIRDGDATEDWPTRPNQPWSEEDRAAAQRSFAPTDGQVERTRRTIEDATVLRHHHENRQQSHDPLRGHLDDVVQAHDVARRLRTLKDLGPYEFIRTAWALEPHRFTANPLHQMLGLNVWC